MKMICKFLIVILFFSVATAYADMIPDPGLEAAIREAFGKPSGPIHVKDLEGLTGLDASIRVIADLTGLEYCTNLEELNLDDNDLGRLHFLDNNITDISPLSELVNLEDLGLGGNKITQY